MEQIELTTAIAYYFKYKPMVYSKYWKQKGYISYLSLSDQEQSEIMFKDRFPRYDYNKNIKMYLIPLDLFKNINSNAFIELNCGIEYQIEISELANSEIHYSTISVSSFEICLKNHIDIFRLIPKKLALVKK